VGRGVETRPGDRVDVRFHEFDGEDSVILVPGAAEP
jgi:hypothetical protein